MTYFFIYLLLISMELIHSLSKRTALSLVRHSTSRHLRIRRFSHLATGQSCQTITFEKLFSTEEEVEALGKALASVVDIGDSVLLTGKSSLRIVQFWSFVMDWFGFSLGQATLEQERRLFREVWCGPSVMILKCE